MINDKLQSNDVEMCNPLYMKLNRQQKEMKLNLNIVLKTAPNDPPATNKISLESQS